MPDRGKTILLVDDEPDILEFLSYALKKEGFKVLTSLSGKDAIPLAKKEIPDLIILDVMMPDVDGIEICRELREMPSLKNTIITFLSARGEDYSQIAGFDAGADDYISKPIRPRVLISRVNALLRRKHSRSTQKEDINSKGLIINRETYTVIKEGKQIEMRKKEFELLALLAEKPGKVFTRDVILSTIWGNEVVVGDRTIDVHVNKLRDKLGENAFAQLKESDTNSNFNKLGYSQLLNQS